jgi:hypothetical protein
VDAGRFLLELTLFGGGGNLGVEDPCVVFELGDLRSATKVVVGLGGGGGGDTVDDAVDEVKFDWSLPK